MTLLGCATEAIEPAETGSFLPTPGPRWEEQIIYQIVTDRFANGVRTNDSIDGVGTDASSLARYQGGDFRGILDNLDYIENLGATAIWLSPIVDNVDRIEDSDGYHGYWGSDFTNVNPHFGSLSDLQDLVSEVHAREMRVIIDVVLNHTGRVFAYDLNENGEVEPGELEPPIRASAYASPLLWTDERPILLKQGQPFSLQSAHFHRQGATSYEAGTPSADALLQGDFPSGLRDLNTENPDVVSSLVETYADWVRLTDIDGFRLDVALHLPMDFWQEFAARFRQRLTEMGKEDFLLLGEVFRADPAQLGSYTTEGTLDSVFDFSLKFGFINEVFVKGRAPSAFSDSLSEAKQHYRSQAIEGDAGVASWNARVTFIDNHDTGRLLSLVDDPTLTALALTLIFTLDGIPAIYYGTEQGLSGTFGHACRERLWDSGYREESEQYRLIRRLSSLRRTHPALTRGSLELRYVSENDGYSDVFDAGLVAYERVAPEEKLLVVLNAHAARDSKASIPVSFADGTRLQNLLHSSGESFEVADGVVNVQLPPRMALLLGEGT